jgi:hypothetical protein
MSMSGTGNRFNDRSPPGPDVGGAPDLARQSACLKVVETLDRKHRPDASSA